MVKKVLYNFYYQRRTDLIISSFYLEKITYIILWKNGYNIYKIYRDVQTQINALGVLYKLEYLRGKRARWTGNFVFLEVAFVHTKLFGK